MQEFNLWIESFYFSLIYSVIIIIPCIIVGLLGKRMIDRLGTYPSRTPSIQLSVFIWLVVVEIVTFTALIGFYRFFDVQ
ncbi:MAG: hypothetical protein KC713_04020 [Candidatus Omnitrophica bacterium]|nr:hypothetical protein [Candidatus Omnitrophota bacterium]